MLGTITLLLFKYIHKIKICDIIDIEFKALEDHVNSLLAKNDPTKVTTLTAPEVTDIRKELLNMQGNIENIKTRVLRT